MAPISVYIGQCSSHFFFVVRASVSWYGAFDNCTCALGQQSSKPLFKSLFDFHTVYADAYWHKIYGICACAFAEQMKSSIFSCCPI